MERRDAVTEEFLQGYHGRTETVHHIDLACPIGRQIPREWMLPGTGSLPLCPTCRMRAEARPASGAYVSPSPAGGQG